MPIPSVEPDIATPEPAVHRLGVGARGNGVAWRGAANYGKKPTNNGKGGPELALPNASRMSFTLRRKGGCEASVDFDQPRGAAWVVEELTTDLWWWRYDPRSGADEAMGRFNADNIDTSSDGQRVRTSCSWVDYGALLGARIITTGAAYVAGTSVVSILTANIPINVDIDVSVLGTVNLGTISTAVDFQAGSTIEDVITGCQDVCPAFDWAVEMADGAGDGFPVLKLWPGARGVDRGVILHDAGAGGSSLASWSRSVEGSEYATAVFVLGDAVSALQVTDSGYLPAGQRDVAISDLRYKTSATASARALSELILRTSTYMVSWSLTLAPNFWRGRSHIDVGDTITIHVVMGSEVLSQQTVVEEISVDIDASGQETVSISTGKARLPKSPRSRYAIIPRIVKIIKKKK